MAIDLTLLPKMQLARRIADELGDPDPAQRSQIRKIVLQHGNRYAVKLLLRTQKIEADGGWVTPNASDAPTRCLPSEVYIRLHQIYQRPILSNKLKGKGRKGSTAY